MNRPEIPARPPAVAVFGSSEPRPGDPDYERARRLGRLLAEAGFATLSGGYGGVMEAASRGAREGGGPTIGVTCAAFSGRRPNAWLDEVADAADLHDRTRELIRRACGFVVLPGKAGTLAELTFLWALHRAGCLGGRPVVLLGTSLRLLVQALEAHDLLDAAEISMNRIADSPEQAVERIRDGLRRPGSAG